MIHNTLKQLLRPPLELTCTAVEWPRPSTLRLNFNSVFPDLLSSSPKVELDSEPRKVFNEQRELDVSNHNWFQRGEEERERDAHNTTAV